MKQHWGSQWESVRERAIEAGIQLDEAVNPPPAWADVESEIEGMFQLDDADRQSVETAYLRGISDPITAEWIQKTFNVDGLTINSAMLADAQDVVFDLSDRIDPLFETYYGRLESAVREIWDTKRYNAAPLYDPGGGGVFPMARSTGFTYKGWCIGYVVKLDEFPELRQMAKDLQMAVRERDRLIQELLNRYK